MSRSRDVRRAALAAACAVLAACAADSTGSGGAGGGGGPEVPAPAVPDANESRLVGMYSGTLTLENGATIQVELAADAKSEIRGRLRVPAGDAGRGVFASVEAIAEFLTRAGAEGARSSEGG